MEHRIAPITREELGLYLSSQNGTLAYNLPLWIPLGSNNQFEKAKKSLEQIFEAHPALNTRFFMKEGDIFKHVVPTPLTLEKGKEIPEDLSTLVKPFELVDAPLYRFAYFENDKEAFLFADFHHTLMDGFSLKMFLDDFAKGFEGLVIEKEAYYQIDDALAKQSRRDDKAAFDADKEYFSSTFGAIDVDSSLTSDHKDENVAHNKIRIDLPSISDKDVTDILGKANVHRSSFFLGAFALTLGQATFAEEVFFLTVNNGRSEQAKKSYGMFVKTLPIYVDHLDAGDVNDYLRKVDAEQKSVIEHSSYSYSDFVSDLSLSPEVLFSYQGEYYYQTKIGSKEVEVTEIPVKDGKEKLAIELFRKDGKFFADIEYRADLYDEDMIRALAKRFAHFVKELCAKSRLEDIEPCDQEDLDMVKSYNAADLSNYDLNRDFVQDIEDHIKANPERDALVDKTRHVTYGELGRISDALADYIVSKGISKDQIVSILIDRNVYMGIASLGVLKAGAAYQPLDPNYPDERLNFMMEDAEAKLLICDRGLESRITYKCPIIYTDEIDALPVLNLEKPKPDGNDLYIMLYTSGSTGKPKGVQLERHNISIFVQWQRRFCKITDESRFFAYASFGFDANMFDLYGALTNGLPLYIVDEEMRLDLKRLNAFYEENHLTHGVMTTQVGRQFAEDYDNHSLQCLVVGGEKLVPVEPPADYRLVNGYGPTECTIIITAFDVDKMYYRVPIGKGMDINHLYVLDKKMRPLPFGVPGYLYASGPQVSRGYKNRPEENAKAFLKNPFEKGIWERMYFTGDVVRFLKDGTVDFIGRKDGQVKIRGFRIEMSEVERVIRDFPGVKEATVNAYPAASGGSFLAGYVVSDEQLDLEAIKAFIGERKPYYMIPEVMMQIDRIPLNQNQKVNKRALPLPKREEKEVVPPSGKKEEDILAVAEKVLGYNGVSVTQDLFEAGLTSISSIKFITLVSAALNRDISTGDLRANPTIRALAALSGEEEVVVDENLNDYPLTKTQEGIYVEWVRNPKSTIYNIPILYRLDNQVDVKQLVKAVENAINAHPYLKGHLVLDNEGMPRMVKSSDAAKVEVVSSSLPEPFALEPYDLMKGPLYQAKIYQSDKELYLFFDAHHIACDGTALAALLQDVEVAYEGKEIEPEKKDGYVLALEEKKLANEETIQKQKAYYASFLDGVDCPSLPRKEYDLPKDSKPLEGDYKINVNPKDLQRFFKENGFNPNGFFNAAFAYALSVFNGNEDALFTSIYSGRDRSSTARTMTMMVKTLPVYAKAEAGQNSLDYIKILSKQIQESEANTLYSFAEISHDFGVKADVMFAYQGDGFVPSSIGGRPATLIHLNGDEVKAPFSVDCLERESNYELHFEVDPTLFRVDTMTYFSRLFECVVKGFVSKKALNQIELVDEQTKQELDAYNATDCKVTIKTYLDALAKVVASTPDKKAVVGIDETLTFAQFNERLNQVARAVIDLGLKADDKIIVMVPRIANAYVAREGVLKAGACFVPVDPAYPDERILYIYEDSEAKAILTTRELYNQKSATFGKANFLILEDVLANQSKEEVKADINPSSLAYCIYTSGSTGKPKGVMIEHHSLANLVFYDKKNYVAVEYVDYCHNAVSLASLSFDLSIQEEFIPLANGMTVMIASEDEILNPIMLAKRMKENDIDILTTTPSYVNNVLDIPEVMEAFTKLNVIDLGAEALPATMVKKMRDKGMNCFIQNGYGPTETTVTCTMDRVESERITIGFPDNNVKTYIIDKDLRRLPFGAVGELLIGGEGVARGYIHRDDLNKEKFIHFDGVYAYRSGDMARLNYDGRIEFFGRKDNQVKLRGLRVELDEIENAMQTVPGISRAVVVVKETAEEGQFLVGYYLAKEALDPNTIKDVISKTLTPYMIPKVFMHLESIPLTSNGKVNKKALPEPVLSSASSGGKKGVRLPKNDVQKAFYEIFQHVLGVKELSIDDDFFDLGGTSLSASKVTMLAMGKGFNIAYSDVFDNPTVIDLAALAMHQGKKEEAEKTEETSEQGLENNVIAHVDEIRENLADCKSILLTGCTGFLGVHIFRELMISSNCKVIGLIRGNDQVSGKERLQGLLSYYFDSPFEEQINERVQIVEADVTSKTLIDDLAKYEFDLIINCAAVVKHFAASDAIEKVNLGGVKNLIEVALAHKARLVQVSTLSVAGENVGGKFPKEKRIHENEIFFGQDISNKYINSKIKAEMAVIDAVNTRGLDGKIVRVGNLMGRASDGEFQVNSGTNNFMATIRAYSKLGVFPVSAADSTIDFSPIDEVAKTIILLARTDAKFTIFHSANGHEVELGDVIAVMNDYGFKIDMVDDETFGKKLGEYMEDESHQMDVSSLISYNSSDSVSRDYILSDNSFTVKALYRLGYKWPITDQSYLERSIASLATLGFFE